MWSCPMLHEQSPQPFFRQIPAYIDAFIPNNESNSQMQGISFPGNCFNSIGTFVTFEDRANENDPITANIELNLSHKMKPGCAEHIQLSSAFTDHYNFFFLSGTHKFSLTFKDEADIVDINKSGLRLFDYCANSFEMLTSTFSTALLFVGGGGTSSFLPVLGAKPTTYQIKQNQVVYQQFSGVRLQDRVLTDVIVDWDKLDTGDLLVTRRWTGRPSVGMLMSGSMATGVSMIIKANGETWVADSQPFEWFSTTKLRGVQVHKLEEWLEQSRDALSEVAWLPLDPKLRHDVIYRRTHNVLQDLQDWFQNYNQRSDYSFAKEFFADVDSAEDKSFPMPFNAGALPIFLRLFDKYANSQNWDELIEGLDLRYQEVYSRQQHAERQKEMQDEIDQHQDENPFRIKQKKLGGISSGKRITSLEEAVMFAAQDLDMTLQELVAEPEQDSWTYDVHSGIRAFTSAEFVMEVYKQMGLFADVQINSSEFTVQDVVELNIFDSMFQPPEECMEADVHLGYCQLMGDTRLELMNYNTKQIQSHSNEDCPNNFVTHFMEQDGCN